MEALARQSALYPQEQPVKVKSNPRALLIGVPKEKELQENRLCLTPESVGILVNNGHEIVIETEAGEEAGYADNLYSEKGARIVYSSREAFNCDIVLKVEPPSLDELDYMKRGATLISAIQMSHLQIEYLKAVALKKLTAVAFELIEDKGNLKPVVRSMSEIASYRIITLAGEYLSKTKNGQGVIFGGVTGVPPVKIVILGAGTIAENVARVARTLGADVRIFDNHHYKLRRIKKDLGEQLYTSIIDNYTLSRELEDADVVIGALRSEEGRSLCVVSDEMVQNMKEGALIIDASISQGGCFETSRITSHDSPSYIKHGVIHYCVPNIASSVPRTATRALSYIFTPILLQLARESKVEDMIASKAWFMKGVYSYNGYVTNEHIAKKFGMNCKDLGLLLAARF